MLVANKLVIAKRNAPTSLHGPATHARILVIFLTITQENLFLLLYASFALDDPSQPWSPTPTLLSPGSGSAQLYLAQV